MRNNRKQLQSDIRFVREVGKIMIQFEKRRKKEIENRAFLLTPEAQERLDRIQRYIDEAKIPPKSFRFEFDPIGNQVRITLAEYCFSNFCYPLHEILGLVDVYGLDARNDGTIVLEATINNAAYELEV